MTSTNSITVPVNNYDFHWVDVMQRRGPFKAQSLQILRERGVPVGTVLDVGILHGTPELVAAYPLAKHLLFEPVVEFRSRIEATYKSIDHELIEVAISDETGVVTLKTFAKLEGMDISHSQMAFEESAGAANTRTVPMYKMDDILRDKHVPEPFLLKIDIDGHEVKVLRGATETLKKTSILIMEVVSTTIPDRIAAAHAAGFRLFDLCEPCYYDKAFWQCDAIFVRNNVFDAHFKKIGVEFVQSYYETFY